MPAIHGPGKQICMLTMGVLSLLVVGVFLYSDYYRQHVDLLSFFMWVIHSSLRENIFCQQSWWRKTILSLTLAEKSSESTLCLKKYCFCRKNNVATSCRENKFALWSKKRYFDSEKITIAPPFKLNGWPIIMHQGYLVPASWMLDISSTI